MNAGGVLNTCKSNGDSGELALFYLSGGRVSNAWVTYPVQGDNGWKRPLKPHNIGIPHDVPVKYS